MSTGTSSSTTNFKGRESLTHPGGPRPAGKGWTHHSVSSSAQTCSCPDNQPGEGKKSREKPDHSRPMAVISQGKRTCSGYLIERRRCQVTSKRKKCAQGVLYLSMCSWHRGDLLYWNGTGWEGLKGRVLLKRGESETDNSDFFSFWNFNLLDKNNSKWGTEYAWGREGILSFSGDSSLNRIANYVSHCAVQFS